MTYKLSPIIEKSESPVVLRLLDGVQKNYESGSADSFEQNLSITSIRAEDEAAVIELFESVAPAMNWTGEEQSFF